MTNTPDGRNLSILDAKENQDFHEPLKKIHEGPDVAFFQTSRAYSDIVTFLLQLNASLFPRQPFNEDSKPSRIQSWELGSADVPPHPTVSRIASLLEALTALLDDAPPTTGPRRFGNVAFRTWHDLASSASTRLLDEHLRPHLQIHSDAAMLELRAYLLGAFGSAQRLDYGTGHELSFLAFLSGVWKLGGFELDSTKTTHGFSNDDGATERSIVLGAVEPYLVLVRRLIRTYTLEPAGSHGVWGLDDHSFLPYIFGSAQLGPPIPPHSTSPVPTEGSHPSAPDASLVAKSDASARLATTNMYFAATSFIHDVKRGPFWEHSPMLWDISGVRAGWAKINKGMLKMYAAEVLAKFPVVQHFPFGGLFRWERDPRARDGALGASSMSVHVNAMPVPPAEKARAQGEGAPSTRAPWAAAAGGSAAGTASGAAGMPPTRAPWAASPGNGPPATGMPPTRAPWAKAENSSAAGPGGQAPPPMAPTRAPWAKGP